MHCRTCGALSSDGDAYCKSCGARLHSDERRHISNGWERSGNVWGMAFGIFLLLLGLAIASGVNVWQSIGAIIMIGIGSAILAGALVGLRRRERE
ncbi:MAG TPA: hypothetical protein P5290_00910 [Candidatus Methanomethylicus sp.]|nr:hypothetical protein [Candidatus Methanomethylicus sp.]